MLGNNKILIPLAIVVSGVMIAGAVIYVNQGEEKLPLEKGKAQVQPDNLLGKEAAKISVENEPTLGSPSAGVTLIEFSDFECSFCARFANNAFLQIKKEYVDSGKVKIFFKNFPLPFHKDAKLAAQAGECALLQGKFWEYKEILFKNQSALSARDLKKYAVDLGLDAEKFNKCLDSGETRKEVEQDLEEGREADVSGTPAFFINGELLVGAQPFSAFQEVIEKLLKGD
jgi:protein-disulfide isomerase